MTSDGLVDLLTSKCIVKIRKSLSYSEAVYTRDSISRYLYEWVFNSIVKLINGALKHTVFGQNDFAATIRDTEVKTSIGILDIFGFEDLEPNHPNSFEQLLINYCNEKLHSFFLEQLLYRDTVLYKTEGIHDRISTTPSSNVLELLFQQSFVCTVMSGLAPKFLNTLEVGASVSDSNDSHPFSHKIQHYHTIYGLLPYNIVSILDESSKIPIKGSRDHAFCNKVHLLNNLISANKSSSRTSIVGRDDFANLDPSLLCDLTLAISHVIPKQKLHLEKTFTINHFAGPVRYSSSEFVAKNTDFLSSTLEEALCSRVAILRSGLGVVGAGGTMAVAGAVGETGVSGSSSEGLTSVSKLTPLVPPPASGSNQPTALPTNKNRSVSSMFVRQVQSMLADELHETQSHFIRCIKPNNSQKALVFDAEKVYRQLQIGGIIQILDIMIHGYPCRIPYGQIYGHFKSVIELDPNGETEALTLAKAQALLKDERTFISLLLEFMGFKEKTDYQLGLTRIFFKFNVLDKVEHFIQQCSLDGSHDWKVNLSLIHI